jgi:hypothetical protein
MLLPYSWMEKILAILSATYLAAGVIYFASRRKSYHHLRHTISELGEKDAPGAKAVNFSLFLPVGLLLVSLGLTTNFPEMKGITFCLAAGYLVAVFFPCDPGSPWSGSTRQQIHNIGGFIEYAGGLYFLNSLSDEIEILSLTKNTITGILLVCIVLTSIPGISIRGLAQRIAECILFGSLIALTYL